MSSAFVKEGEYQRLEDVGPSINALMVYLQRENGGLRIYEKKNYYNAEHERDVYQMTDGLSYAKNDEGKWYIVWD
jgi:GTP cyclohydrolase II